MTIENCNFLDVSFTKWCIMIAALERLHVLGGFMLVHAVPSTSIPGQNISYKVIIKTFPGHIFNDTLVCFPLMRPARFLLLDAYF